MESTNVPSRVGLSTTTFKTMLGQCLSIPWRSMDNVVNLVKAYADPTVDESKATLFKRRHYPNISSPWNTTVIEAFERKLLLRGFVCTDNPSAIACEHVRDKSIPTYVLYVQECYEPPVRLRLSNGGEMLSHRWKPRNCSTSLHWERSSGCDSCCLDGLDALRCGGHYHNIRVFCRRNAAASWKAVNVDRRYQLKQRRLDPIEPIYEQEDFESLTDSQRAQLVLVR